MRTHVAHTHTMAFVLSSTGLCRCAKLTLSGMMVAASDPEDIATGKAALFARHPQMSVR